MRHPCLQVLTCGLVLAAWCSAVQAGGSYTPRVDYILNCQGCHLPDGSGTPGKVPALKQQVGRFLHVPGGREYLIRVPGTAQSELSDAEVAAVLNWILENFSKAELPPGFVPYSATEVARYRHRPLADVAAVRFGLMAEVLASQASRSPD